MRTIPARTIFIGSLNWLGYEKLWQWNRRAGFFEECHQIPANIFFYLVRQTCNVNAACWPRNFAIPELVNGNRDRSSGAIKGRRKRATCPLWSADCTLCWTLPRTYGRRSRYPRISDDSRISLAPAILRPPSIGARNDPARLNCSRPHATVTVSLTIPRIVVYCIHTRKCTRVIPPAVYTRGPITGVRGIRRKHRARWLVNFPSCLLRFNMHSMHLGNHFFECKCDIHSKHFSFQNATFFRQRFLSLFSLCAESSWNCLKELFLNCFATWGQYHFALLFAHAFGNPYLILYLFTLFYTINTKLLSLYYSRTQSVILILHYQCKIIKSNEIWQIIVQLKLSARFNLSISPFLFF